jgi:hypothetical protein
MPSEARRHAHQSKLSNVRAAHWASYESLSKPWCVRLSLTKRRGIARTMLHNVLIDQVADLYLDCDMHCSSDKNLAYYEVTTITGHFRMVIITLGYHNSILSC